MRKIAFFGPAASGKTWCANHLVDKHNFEKVAFADKLKEIARDLFGVTGKNGPDRKVLQDLGQKMREIQEDVWINYLLKNVEGTSLALEKDYKSGWLLTQPIGGWVLDDLRYVNEAAALREDGWTLIMVATPQEIREWRLTTLYPDTPLSSYYHASEQEWQEIQPDYVVSSDSEATRVELDKILELDGVIK